MDLNITEILPFGLDILVGVAVLTHKLKKYFPNHKELLPMGVGIGIVFLMQSAIGEMILGGITIGIMASLAYDLSKPLTNPAMGVLAKYWKRK